jgi:hypothetical protein
LTAADRISDSYRAAYFHARGAERLSLRSSPLGLRRQLEADFCTLLDRHADRAIDNNYNLAGHHSLEVAGYTATAPFSS